MKYNCRFKIIHKIFINQRDKKDLIHIIFSNKIKHVELQFSIKLEKKLFFKNKIK